MSKIYRLSLGKAISLCNIFLKYVRIRKRILKSIDEVNRCKTIITDDMFIVHAALALRKKVHFLDINNLNMNIEFFGQGQHYHIGDFNAPKI